MSIYRGSRVSFLAAGSWSLLGVILLCFMCGSASAAAAKPASCASGLTALNSGNLHLAESIYRRTPSCERNGLAAATALVEARQLFALGLISAADSALVQALRAEPALVVPAQVLPPSFGPAGVKFAETLQRDGFHDQAIQILLQVIEHHPGIRLDHADQQILGTAGHTWHWWLWHLLTRPLALAIEPIAALFALGLYSRLRRRLYFQTFSNGDDPEAGPDTAAMLRVLIRAELHRLAEETATLPAGQPVRIDQAGPYEDDFSLDGITDGLPPVWKVLCQVAGLILNRLGSNSRLVTGALRSKQEVVIGIETVHGGLQQIGVIKPRDLGFPEADQDHLAQLALPTAVWIILAHDRRVRLGGSDDWKSYSYFAAGCAWQERAKKAARNNPDEAEADLARAKELYERACLDPSNLAAAVNLAALDQLAELSLPFGRPTGRLSYDYLRWIADETEGLTNDFQWFRARYLLSLGLSDMAESLPPTADVKAPASPTEMITEARSHALKIARQLQRRLDDRGRLPESFVSHGRAAALTMLARLTFPATVDLEDALNQRSEGQTRLTKESITGFLTELDHPDADLSGVPELLAEFARANCPHDDQVNYNFFRYHRTRAMIYSSAIEGWRDLLEKSEGSDYLTLPSSVARWRDDVRLWQDVLEERHQMELAEMFVYQTEVLRAGDPVILVQVEHVASIPIARKALGPGQRHHELFGTEHQPSLPTKAPPKEPPGYLESSWSDDDLTLYDEPAATDRMRPYGSDDDSGDPDGLLPA
jgi:hypothetical protein